MAEPTPAPLDLLISGAVEAISISDPDLFAAEVVERLRSPQPAAMRGRVPLERRRTPPAGALAAGLVALCLLGASLLAPVRSALAGLLGVDGVRITRTPTITGPTPVPSSASPTTPVPSSASPTTSVRVDPLTALHVGEPTSLLDVARLVGFSPRVPTIAGYQHPDAVYVARPPAGGMASLIYLPTSSRPAVAAGGVAALLSEFRGHLDGAYFQKMVGNGTTVEAVRVGGTDGYWLSGAPHEFFYVAADGTVDSETIRLATDTLLWSAGGITYRLESALSRDRAISLAVSMR